MANECANPGISYQPVFTSTEHDDDDHDDFVPETQLECENSNELSSPRYTDLETKMPLMKTMPSGLPSAAPSHDMAEKFWWIMSHTFAILWGVEWEGLARRFKTDNVSYPVANMEDSIGDSTEDLSQPPYTFAYPVFYSFRLSEALLQTHPDPQYFTKFQQLHYLACVKKHYVHHVDVVEPWVVQFLLFLSTEPNEYASMASNLLNEYMVENTPCDRYVFAGGLTRSLLARLLADTSIPDSRLATVIQFIKFMIEPTEEEPVPLSDWVAFFEQWSNVAALLEVAQQVSHPWAAVWEDLKEEDFQGAKRIKLGIFQGIEEVTDNKVRMRLCGCPDPVTTTRKSIEANSFLASRVTQFCGNQGKN